MHALVNTFYLLPCYIKLIELSLFINKTSNAWLAALCKRKQVSRFAFSPRYAVTRQINAKHFLHLWLDGG